MNDGRVRVRAKATFVREDRLDFVFKGVLQCAEFCEERTRKPHPPVREEFQYWNHKGKVLDAGIILAVIDSKASQQSYGHILTSAQVLRAVAGARNARAKSLPTQAHCYTRSNSTL